MIYKESKLKIVDNSGGKWGLCIGIPGGTKKKYATVGDIVKVSIKQAIPNAEVKKGDVCDAMIVGTKKGVSRSDGTHVRFNINAAVVVNQKGELRATRVFSPVFREIKAKQAKIASLSPETI